MQQLERTKNVTKRSKKYLEEALYQSLFKEDSSEISVRQQLNQFLESSKRVFKWEVDETLKKLHDPVSARILKKLTCPLVWRPVPGCMFFVSITRIEMSCECYPSRDLDLVAKAQGIPATENYFVDLPESSKNHLTYGALLNCYCKELMTEKAKALIEKMKELNLPLGSMSYNSLTTLYTKIGQPERVSEIVQEMKSCGTMLDSFTYNVWMRALAIVNDISGVERVIEKMKRDAETVDWTTYSNITSFMLTLACLRRQRRHLRNWKREMPTEIFLLSSF
ncbi:hypothetical protein V6N13_135038 [Hibiscus sabdariffa]|uniref:Pentatricopeptide repeat-containing protein n=1 Tax=Hibiscus sabdariffa TaxID=183260 RepID=A0ABR2R5N9_9ROSI